MAPRYRFQEHRVVTKGPGRQKTGNSAAVQEWYGARTGHMSKAGRGKPYTQTRTHGHCSLAAMEKVRKYLQQQFADVPQHSAAGERRQGPGTPCGRRNRLSASYGGRCMELVTQQSAIKSLNTVNYSSVWLGVLPGLPCSVRRRGAVSERFRPWAPCGTVGRAQTWIVRCGAGVTVSVTRSSDPCWGAEIMMCSGRYRPCGNTKSPDPTANAKQIVACQWSCVSMMSGTAHVIQDNKWHSKEKVYWLHTSDIKKNQTPTTAMLLGITFFKKRFTFRCLKILTITFWNDYHIAKMTHAILNQQFSYFIKTMYYYPFELLLAEPSITWPIAINVSQGMTKLNRNNVYSRTSLVQFVQANNAILHNVLFLQTHERYLSLIHVEGQLCTPFPFWSYSNVWLTPHLTTSYH